MDLPVDYRSIPQYQRRLVREEYVRLQKGLCYYCNSSLIAEPPHSILNKRIRENLFPKGFFNHPIHLHHCHKTGMTIGAVHAYCNAVLWQYEGE